MTDVFVVLAVRQMGQGYETGVTGVFEKREDAEKLASQYNNLALIGTLTLPAVWARVVAIPLNMTVAAWSFRLWPQELVLDANPLV